MDIMKELQEFDGGCCNNESLVREAAAEIEKLRIQVARAEGTIHRLTNEVAYLKSYINHDPSEA